MARSKVAPVRWGDAHPSKVRVLLECPPEESPHLIASLLGREGFAVEVCEGPSIGACPLITSGACALVDQADVVVNLLETSDDGPRVAPAIESLRRSPALVVERPRPGTTSLLVGPATPAASTAATVLHPPLTRRSLIAAIKEALRRRSTPVAWWGDGIG
jgi:hypothetical protein